MSESHRLKPNPFEKQYIRSQSDPSCVETVECGRPYSDSEILAQFFTYHPTSPEQIPKYAAINQAAKNFAEVILQNCPPGADRSAAIRLIREARMTANASVELNGLSL